MFTLDIFLNISKLKIPQTSISKSYSGIRMKIMSLGMESCALAKRMDFLVNLLFFKHLVKCLALYRVLFSGNAVQLVVPEEHLLKFYLYVVILINLFYKLCRFLYIHLLNPFDKYPLI